MTDDERNSLAGEAPQRTARGYTGHEHLERTGLIHMNGRVYDPVIGRFLSPDPVVANASFSQSWNAYSYALNSPLSYSDPSGLTFVAGCPPSLCGGSGRGGFAPSSVMARSLHVTRSVTYSLTLSFMNPFSLGFPSVDTGNPLILNISDPNGSSGARRASPLESAQHRRLAGSGPRIRLAVRGTVTTQRAVILAEVGIGEEQSPADTPIEQVAGRIVLAQIQENPQAETIDRLIEAAVNGEAIIPLDEFIGGLRDFPQGTLDTLRDRGTVTLLDVIVSDDSTTATGTFENTATEETVLPLRPGVMILAPTIRGTFRVSEGMLELESLEGIRGGAFRRTAGPVDSITIPRIGDYDFTRPNR